MKALNEILEYGYYMQPLDQNRKCIDDWRAIGLGVFGLADMLIALGVRYGSEYSIEVVEDVMHEILCQAIKTSTELAKKYGTFDKYNWEYVKESPLIKMLPTELYDLVKENGLRNGSLISIAPTGSIATMTGLSGGVEPLYQIAYERTTHALEKTGKTFKVIAKSVDHLMKKLDLTLEEAEKLDYVIASHNINPLNRVKLQATMQQYNDNAISSTINLKHEATVQDIYNTYIKAWELGCKGITIFRDGCARTSILGKQDSKPSSNDIEFDTVLPVKVGETDFRKYIKRTACVEKLYVFVGHDDKNNIVEVFTNIVQGCTSNIGTETRLASALLRAGVKVDYIVKQMRKTKCQGCIKAKERGEDVSFSCGSAIADAIEEEYKRLKQLDSTVNNDIGLLPCPECGQNTLKPEGKCQTCINCGYSRCDN